MKLIAVVLAAFLMTGCASQMQQRQAVQDTKNYISENKPRAQRGEMSWTVYLKGLYSHVSSTGAPGDTLSRINEAIRAAEDYENGRIPKSDFEYRIRQLDSQDRSASQMREQQAAQTRSAQLAAAAQYFQANAQRSPVTTPAAATVPAAGLIGFLQSQSVNGFLRYCRYSNGVVNTINSVELCPLNTQ